MNYNLRDRLIDLGFFLLGAAVVIVGLWIAGGNL